MKVLIAEDEFEIAQNLATSLQKNGHFVDVEHAGADALKCALTSTYDIILLDILMPGMDGREVLQNLRARGDKTPVIFLSGLDSTDDRIKGLKLGADDYILKPFTFAELIARMQAVKRRCQQTTHSTIYKVGDLVIDIVSNKVTRQNTVIDLAPKEFALLSLLAENIGIPVSRVLIAQRIWNLGADQKLNIVDVNMKRLRMKIDDPFAKQLIHNKRGFGFILEDRV